MDALVDELAIEFKTGRKSLVFVRRVASVDEIQRKLEERYDDWLVDYLPLGWPPATSNVSSVNRSKNTAEPEQTSVTNSARRMRRLALRRETATNSSVDSFFAWFFRGEGPSGVRSGASLAVQLAGTSGNYATFFEDNYVAALLGVSSGRGPERSRRRVGSRLGGASDQLAKAALRHLPHRSRLQRKEQFRALQIAALEQLEGKSADFSAQARIIREQLYAGDRPLERVAKVAPTPEKWLTVETLFTALRLRPGLREALWPEPASPDFFDQFRRREWRRELLASMVRKGHPIVDLFILVTNRIGDSQAKGSLGHRKSATPDFG